MDHEYCFGVESESLKEIVPGALLGPEGTAVWLVFSAGPGKGLLRQGVTGGWSLFENYTVDASICGQVFKGAR
ncbi:hypothetical protein, partial [Streptomyces sp. WAC07149]|uniref:hypothetical protein n=1 Tax=Streptomyces sp. WAC07149 TaxID=2487425 RepID=UPI001C8E03A4